MKFGAQVPREHYFKDYDTKERFISYWYQIDEVLRTNPKNVLEIGVGNKTVSNYLKNQGIEVTTVDIDPSLEPDRVGSVTNLRKFFEEGSFDTLLCAEVLEHLPFDCFEVALKEMKYVAKNFVILSLPYFGIEFMFRFKVPLVKEKKLLFKIPYYREHRFDGEHYWEIGKKGYSIKFILKILSKLFVINRYYYIADNPYHMIFALDVKDKEIN
ncbi:UPF0146 family protein [Methanotrichaceae archaeon M04Ac]|jgi:hypothetical protein|uniref:UPF0146 family protein n=1 Tax=Candidatus Methanocrinis alkalitolerans TaxID=3033395 RepID=A0ABT5XBG4_9EURY|nr:methyltransferase domain-containing protein [Candidatus Methanocrinis alkalitolerans]MCR3883218.1 class I SAM-dependent methyltransferase [Methanothrix sp.]MDF0592027.1 UPF0146 family protein [Candidatus Methanocrinis alkalitolerans]